MRGISFKARSLASHSIVLRMARDASGSVDEIEMDEQRQQLRAAYAYDLMLDTEVEYYHKMLAKAEELLEGKVRRRLADSPLHMLAISLLNSACAD